MSKSNKDPMEKAKAEHQKTIDICKYLVAKLDETKLSPQQEELILKLAKWCRVEGIQAEEIAQYHWHFEFEKPLEE